MKIDLCILQKYRQDFDRQQFSCLRARFKNFRLSYFSENSRGRDCQSAIVTKKYSRCSNSYFSKTTVLISSIKLSIESIFCVESNRQLTRCIFCLQWDPQEPKMPNLLVKTPRYSFKHVGLTSHVKVSVDKASLCGMSNLFPSFVHHPSIQNMIRRNMPGSAINEFPRTSNSFLIQNSQFDFLPECLNRQLSSSKGLA